MAYQLAAAYPAFRELRADALTRPFGRRLRTSWRPAERFTSLYPSVDDEVVILERTAGDGP